MARQRGDVGYGAVVCWAHGCRDLGTRAVPVAFTRDLSVTLALCVRHEDDIRALTGRLVRERLPARVSEDREEAA